MTRLLEIQESIQETTAKLGQLDKELAGRPESRTLALSGKSLEKRLQALEDKFLIEANSVGIDVCSYRLFGSQEPGRLSTLTAVLGGFQTLVSVVYDALKSGVPKQPRRVSADAANETSFNLSYVFPGSLGLVLTLPNERLLIGESKLDDAFSAIFEMTKIQSSSEILSFAKEFGTASIHAMYGWTSSHVEAGMGVDIEWRRERLIRANLLAQMPEFEHVSRVIMATSDEEVQDLDVEGELVGCDVINRSFHFRPIDGEDIRGRFENAIGPAQAAQVPKRYRAKVTMTRKTHFATEEEDLSFHLNLLEPL